MFLDVVPGCRPNLRRLSMPQHSVFAPAAAAGALTSSNLLSLVTETRSLSRLYPWPHLRSPCERVFAPLLYASAYRPWTAPERVSPG